MVGAVQTDGPVIGVLASDRGPGDPERASLMSEMGRLFARKGARLICLAEEGVLPAPLITTARTAGGAVEILADESIVLPRAIASVPISIIPDRAARLARLAEMSQVLVGLPGSLASASSLFGAWTAARDEGRAVPVVMLNRHRAFEAIRGFAADVLAPAVSGYDRNVQFAETVEDLWNKVNWVLQQKR